MAGPVSTLPSVDERGLAHARHAGDADPMRAPRRVIEERQKPPRLRPVLGLAALDERDGARNRDAPALADIGRQRFDVVPVVPARGLSVSHS